MKIFKSKSGFTLIELMVVIAVIGILASFAFPQFSRVQLAAKDAERKSNLASYHLALQRYFGQVGGYPVGGDGLSPYLDVSADTPSGIFASGNPLVTNEFLPGPLLDPINTTASGFYYRYRTDQRGSKYVLYAKMETGEFTWWVQGSSGGAEGASDEPQDL